MQNAIAQRVERVCSACKTRYPSVSDAFTSYLVSGVLWEKKSEIQSFLFTPFKTNLFFSFCYCWFVMTMILVPNFQKCPKVKKLTFLFYQWLSWQPRVIFLKFNLLVALLGICNNNKYQRSRLDLHYKGSSHNFLTVISFV